MITQIYIMRGVPGSGKSTWAKNLSSKLPDHKVKVFSADHFFEGPNGYVFNPAKIREAHNACKKGFEACLRFHDITKTNEKVIVVVDNTNIKTWEAQWYVDMATRFGVDYSVVTIVLEPHIAAKRNVHGVPLDKVGAMYANMMAEELPMGWNKEFVVGVH